jgi:hypothetical protein
LAALRSIPRPVLGEAKAIWESGEKLYLEGDFLDEAEEAQAKPWKGMSAKALYGCISTHCFLKIGVRWTCMNDAHTSLKGTAA